jgi:hypothetical protein
MNVKRLIIALGLVFVVLLGVVVAIPLFYKSALLDLVKVEINKNVRAKVDFASLDVSLLRSFPNLELGLNEISVVGIDTFEGLPLFKAKTLALSLDLMTVIKGGEVEVQEIALVEPDIRVHVLANGLANYDIAIPADEQVEEKAADYSGFALSLESYRVEEGRLYYDDQVSAMLVSVAGLNHSGSGQFTQDIFDLSTETTIDSLFFSFDGIDYLDKANAFLKAVINVNLPENKYTLKDNELVLNALKLMADGFVQLNEQDIVMDMKLRAPENDFRQLWSIVPNAFTEGYEQVDINGQFSLQARINGTYSDNPARMPAFSLAASVRNGKVKYPDLPMSIADIQADLAIDSPQDRLDGMRIHLSKGDLTVGGDPFRTKMLLLTPISDPNLDLLVNGTIDLNKWAKAFPIPDVDEMSGRIVADVDVKARMSDMDAARYDQLNINGKVDVSNIRYKATDLPLVVVKQANAVFTPRNMQISKLDMTLGRSDLSGSGHIDNILAYLMPEKTMTGQFTVYSRVFDVDEWMEEEPAAEEPLPPAMAADRAAAAAPAESSEIFDRFDFLVTAKADEIRYDVYKIKNASANGRITPNYMVFENAKAYIGDSDFSGSGRLYNAFDYAFENGILGGEFEITSNYLNVNQFMSDTEAAPTAAAVQAQPETPLEVFLVPENMDLTIAMKAQKVDYTNLPLTNVTGKMVIRDEQLFIEEGVGRLLGGKVLIDALYDTQNADKPYYSCKLDLQALDFQEAFTSFNTFQKLAPVGKFIQGKFNTSLVMDGDLGKDMMPLLATLNIDGFIETLNGVINGYAPITAVGNALNVKELKESIRLDNLKSWFSIRNGVVEVKPFDWNVKDIKMQVSGKHGLDQQMNYRLLARIPSEKLTSTAAGQAVSQSLNQLLGQARGLGINVSQPQYLNVQIDLSGSITKPAVALKMLPPEGQTTAAEAAKGAVAKQSEQLRQEAQKQLDQAKGQLEGAANKAADSVRNLANRKAEELQQEAARAAREKLGGVVDSATLKKVEEQGQQTIDQIKDNLQQWNPLKRRKNN